MAREFTDRFVLAALAALVVAHAVPHLFGTVTPPLREALLQSLQLARGEASLTSAWHYLLALPLWAAPSVSGSLAVLGLVASLKFVLAFACGIAWRDARLGAWWAALLAFSPLTLVQPLFPVPMHLVEVAILAALWPLLRLARGAEGHWWGACGLLVGLALHAHLAALVLLPVAIFVAWRRPRGDGGSLVAAVILAALVASPVGIAWWRGGVPPEATNWLPALAHAAMPLFAGALAWVAWRSAVPVRAALAFAVMAAVALGAWQFRVAQQGLLALRWDSALLPAYALDRWSRGVCASGAAVAPGGELRRLVAQGADLGTMLACDDATLSAGSPADTETLLAGLVPAQWHAAGHPAVDWAQALAATQQWRVPGVDVPIAGHVVREYVFRARAGAPVLLEAFPPIEILSVGADGFAREPVTGTRGLAVYRCVDCTGDFVEWRIALRGAGVAQSGVAVLTVPAAASPDSADPSDRSES